MSTKDQAWAERVGKEAVALGMPCGQGLKAASASRHGFIGKPRITDSSKKWLDYIPDFRDRLTELACIAWVKDVAREVYGDADVAGLDFRWSCIDGGFWEARVWPRADASVKRFAPTLVEACIAAVRAMKGGE